VSERHPRFGFTRHGAAVHEHTADHLPHSGPAARFNAWLAVKVTTGVGTMWCAYAFTALALASLPSAISSGSAVTLVSWISQTFLQLVLLSVIIVGQNVVAAAADARSAKTFEDAEENKVDIKTAIDLLDTRTEGGLTAVLDAIAALAARKDGT
jgi:hypothetical protein